MKGILVDANVILDIFTNDKVWADWSESILNQYSATHTLYINDIVYKNSGKKTPESLAQGMNCRF